MRPTAIRYLAILLSAAVLGAGHAHAGDTRTVEDATGTRVEVPAAPQRVIALSELDLDAVLALGMTPAGTINGRGQTTTPRYLGERAAGIASVGNFMQPSIGRLIELQPDLILAGGIPDAGLIQRLRSVAPTAVTYRVDDDWKTAFARIAAILGRPDAAEAFMARYRERVSALRGRLDAHAGESVSIVRWNPRGPMYMQRDAFASLVIRDLGLVRPESQREAGIAHSPPLSLEALHLLDADWLFLGTLRGEGEAAQAMRTALDRPAFRELDVVRRGRVTVVDGSLWTSLGGPLAAMAVLDDVARAMGSP